MNKMHDLLYKACQMKASDLHITAGLSPALRIYGELHRMQEEPLQNEDIYEVAKGVTTEEQWRRFEEQGELDFSYELEKLSRFRLNLFRQRGLLSLAIRVIPNTIPALDDLFLPPVLKQLLAKPQGLLLVTGPTGSGKSTTLAAMIDYMNKTQRKHIVTLEDPIEYVHFHQNSIIQQREVGHDTKSFANGLRAALRQDPDVILVGEMRDLETISTAITAAETGHLVLGTLHTSSAAATIERVIDVFPAEQQNKVRLQLATVLIAAVAQRLFPRMDGNGRIAATEILVNNAAVSNLIRNEKIEHLPSVMLTSKSEGMHMLQTSIKEYMARGIISYEAALPFLQEQERIE
ncbi:type IV pilus twitching motility protein PilT [Ectobacillus panaciterrae]|uniref:type IV pilus twitching motility protein PilT n=1 Tax=Ectobacillus panaciterrae TaxID=363872 RepID=UPI00041A6544|nr:type IV pilus twitching motility protein PilT [Ectobacillus panaciterrae]